MIDKKVLVRDLVIHLKKLGFVNHLVDYINKEIPLTIFPIAKRRGLTINEWVSDVEDASRQHTVLTTTRLSYDGVKSYLVYELNTILSSYKGADIRVREIKDVADNEEIKNKSFDLILEYNGEIVIIEIKVTQSKTGFTGATHSTSKADTYLLIALSVNRNKKVVENQTYINGVFSMLINVEKNEWVGDPTTSSSFTGLKFLNGFDYSDNIICGGLRNKNKYAEIIFEKI